MKKSNKLGIIEKDMINLHEEAESKGYKIDFDTLTIFTNKIVDNFVYSDFINLWASNIYAASFPFPFIGKENSIIEAVGGWTFKQKDDSSV
jgi:hypothetical protein